MILTLNESNGFGSGNHDCRSRTARNVFSTRDRCTDVVDLVERCYREPWKLDVGQVMWYGVKRSAKPSYGRNSKNTPLTPVVLTLVSREDLELSRAGYSTKEIREKKIVRLFTEAYEQEALLTHSDVAFLLHVSTGTVRE